MEINTYKSVEDLNDEQFNNIRDFLYTHLDQFGDAKEDIAKAMQYSLGKDNRPGGFILSTTDNGNVIGAVVVNETGMGGYIPENILVYIATHKDYRGKGVGKKLMQTAMSTAKGDVALHVEPENPARYLYEKLGFTNKYLEMRYKKG